jgi:predicted CXXCH cytochrome family protein
VERQLYDPPPDATFGFLGYFDVTDQVTTCGECHVGKAAGWATTGHASAWEDLQASGAAQAVCEGCHTINERGNALDEPAGYNLVQDERYHDVQCEACHGPGKDHVDNPDAFQPLASLSVGVGLTNGCGDCHQGAHHPFVDQWQLSKHATVPSGTRATNETCMPCHEGKTALEQKFGETDDYIEKGDGQPLAIVCGVCHDPHGSPNENNLRAPIDVASIDHLCVKCHSRIGTPPSSHGPHAAQGLLVLGVNVGWIPPGFAYDTTLIIGTHGTEANPKLCATCHVNIFEVTDQESGGFLFASKGHTFEAIPCVDADGVPVPRPCSLTQRTYNACTASGCHGTETAARSALLVAQGRLHNLLDQLWYDTDGNHVMDATDDGVLPQVVAQGDPTQLDVGDDVITVAEGALWNAQLSYTEDRPWFGDGEAFGVHFSAHMSSGRGAHNPFLLEALLTASIQAVIDTYGVSPKVALDLSVHATPPPGLQ